MLARTMYQIPVVYCEQNPYPLALSYDITLAGTRLLADGNTKV